MSIVTCPGCGTRRSRDSINRTPDGFCDTPVPPDGARCDYPLFFAPNMAVGSTVDTDPWATDRSPAVAGIDVTSTKTCPACAELNDYDEIRCHRCKAILDPEPAPPPPTLEWTAPLQIALPPTPIPSRQVPWWVWVLCGATLATAAALIVVLVA